MKNYRFILMGQQAVTTFMNEGIDALIEQEIEHELACVENPSDPLDVLSQYNGWFDYANLDQDEYIKLGGELPNIKEEFNKYFNEVNPKKMVEFMDAYRNQGLYAFDLRDGSDFLLDESREDKLLHMINSGDFLFGTEKEERETERNVRKQEDINLAATAGVMSYNMFEKVHKEIAKPDGYGVMYAHDIIAQYAVEFVNKHRHVVEWEEYCEEQGVSDWEEYVCIWIEEKIKQRKK